MTLTAAAMLIAGCGADGDCNSNQSAPVAAQQVTGAGSTFVYPVLTRLGRRIPETLENERQLPVDRLGRRNLAGKGGDRRLRNLGSTARFGVARGDQSRAIPDRHRRHRPGDQPDGHRAGQAPADAPAARRHFPGQGRRSLGTPAHLVLLPNEGHAYKARESVMHVMWEIQRWLDIHLSGT
jgi:hypothetical protein